MTAPQTRLTARELEVLRHVSRGRKYHWIARRLSLSVPGVKAAATSARRVLPPKTRGGVGGNGAWNRGAGVERGGGLMPCLTTVRLPARTHDVAILGGFRAVDVAHPERCSAK